MKQTILQLFRKHRKCSFTELVSEMESAGMQVKGNRPLYLKENLLLWHDISPEFCDAVTELIEEAKLGLKPLSRNLALILYSRNGSCPDLPIAERIEACAIPHWLPVILQLQDEGFYTSQIPASNG